MHSISETEAQQNLNARLDSASGEPMVIRRQVNDSALIVSQREHDRLRAIDIEEFEHFCDRIGNQAVEAGLTEAKMSKILAE